MKVVRLLLIATLFVALWSGPAHAQTDTTQTRQLLLQRLHAGTTLRVLVAGQPLTGRLNRISGDSVYFNGHGVLTTDIQNVWIQQRATRRAAKIGAIVGAPVGAGFGAFFMLLVVALCEYDCEDIGAGDVVLGISGFTLAGVVAGGTLGAVIGAAVPQWVEITDPRVRLPAGAAVGQTQPRIIGSVSLAPVFARGEGNEGGGAGARLAYMFHTPNVGVGLEVGRYGTGTGDFQIFVTCPDRQDFCSDTIQVDKRVTHGGGIARFGTGVDKQVEPYATVGLGLYSWSSSAGSAIQLGGYSLGGGIQVRNSTGRRSVFAEGRWQSNLTRSGDLDGGYGFYTLAVGGSIAW